MENKFSMGYMEETFRFGKKALRWIRITKKLSVYQYMNRNIDYNINNKKIDSRINI
jgi:hypothetical protein